MYRPRALRGQSPSGAKGVSEKTLYSGAGFPCVETNDSEGNPKNRPNYSILIVKPTINYTPIKGGVPNPASEGGVVVS